MSVSYLQGAMVLLRDISCDTEHRNGSRDCRLAPVSLRE